MKLYKIISKYKCKAITLLLTISLLFTSGQTGKPEILQKTAKAKPAMLTEQELIDLARSDYLALLKAMMAYYDRNITDYTGTFFKQERISGKLRQPQMMNFKFRNKPFSIFMQWTMNPGPADRLLYVQGQNDNKMVLHPTSRGLRWIKSVKRSPRSKEVFKNSLRSCDQFGIRNLMTRVFEVSNTEKQNGSFKAKYLGEVKIDKRRCAVIEVLTPENQISSTRKMIFAVDIGYRLPVSISSYDADENLISTYTYSSLKFNTGLTDQDFSKKANKL